MSYHIAVDIGGTQMRAACYPQDDTTPTRLDKISTRDPQEPALERLKRLIGKIWPDDGPVEAIGVAAPGPLDPFEGVVLAAPNIPGWVNVPLRQQLEDAFHVPVAVGNDANLAAMGEWKFGAGRGHHHLIYLTISTGIGAGVIIDDRLLLGQHGLAAELGHVSVMPEGPLCGCGQRGHLEAISSGTGIAAYVREQMAAGANTGLPAGATVTAKMVSQAAQMGDPLALEAITRAGKFLGQALADFLHIFNPSIIVIGGGVSQAGELMFEPMRHTLRQRILTPHYLEDLVITRAAFGDEAGLMGSLALARETSSVTVIKTK